MNNYINSAKKQFSYYKMLAEKTFEQVDDQHLFWCYNNESNSIAMIVQHMAGNMLSRWTDFLTSDGEKPWRDRDKEFGYEIKTREELLTKWNAGWDCLFNALDSIIEDNWNNEIYIRNEHHSITEAINRQLAHYPYQVGQIVFIGKIIAGHTWQSLSIPPGKSQAYNEEKFSPVSKTSN